MHKYDKILNFGYVVAVSEGLWRWMTENPDKEKIEWPGYFTADLNKVVGSCLFCEWACQNKIFCVTCKISRACRKWLHKDTETTRYNLWLRIKELKESIGDSNAPEKEIFLFTAHVSTIEVR